MHPAYSVILFTTASGAGYGLLFLLGIANALNLTPSDRGFGALALGLAFVLISAGLLSSTFHLGHPERAWRAFSQWRSSWLSREGVLALATYGPFALFAFGWLVLGEAGGIWSLCGLLAAIGAAATVACTGMIYQSLWAIPQWHHRLVTPIYLALALMSGAVLLHALLALVGAAGGGFAWLTAAAIAFAGLLKMRYWQAMAVAVPASSVASATGLDDLGPARLLDPPHTEPNYLQREMGFRIARKHRIRLRRLVIVWGIVVPQVASLVALVPLAGLAGLAALTALAAAALGIVVERWLFFAEAEHKVMLYYGAEAV